MTNKTAITCEFIGGPLDGLLAPVSPFTCKRTGKAGVSIGFDRVFTELEDAIWLARQPLQWYAPDFTLKRLTWSPP